MGCSVQMQPAVRLMIRIPQSRTYDRRQKERSDGLNTLQPLERFRRLTMIPDCPPENYGEECQPRHNPQPYQDACESLHLEPEGHARQTVDALTSVAVIHIVFAMEPVIELEEKHQVRFLVRTQDFEIT